MKITERAPDLAASRFLPVAGSTTVATAARGPIKAGSASVADALHTSEPTSAFASSPERTVQGTLRSAAGAGKGRAPVPACDYDPVLHVWRLEGRAVPSEPAAAGGVSGVLDGSTVRSATGRTTSVSGSPRRTMRPTTEAYNATYGRIFGPPPASPPRRSLAAGNSGPAALAKMGEAAAALASSGTLRSGDTLASSATLSSVLPPDMADAAGATARSAAVRAAAAAALAAAAGGPVAAGTIVAPVAASPDLAKTAAKYWRTHNFDPIKGRYIDGDKEATISSIESAEAEARRTARYARMPQCAKEQQDRGAAGLVFLGGQQFEEVLRPGRRRLPVPGSPERRADGGGAAALLGGSRSVAAAATAATASAASSSAAGGAGEA